MFEKWKKGWSGVIFKASHILGCKSIYSDWNLIRPTENYEVVARYESKSECNWDKFTLVPRDRSDQVGLAWG